MIERMKNFLLLRMWEFKRTIWFDLQMKWKKKNYFVDIKNLYFVFFIWYYLYQLQKVKVWYESNQSIIKVGKKEIIFIPLFFVLNFFFFTFFTFFFFFWKKKNILQKFCYNLWKKEHKINIFPVLLVINSQKIPLKRFRYP